MSRTPSKKSPGNKAESIFRIEDRKTLIHQVASITIRNLDDDVKTRLRAQAAEHHRSMAEEVRLILREAVDRKPDSRNLAEIAHSIFGPDNGVDLELPPRGPVREPPTFD